MDNNTHSHHITKENMVIFEVMHTRKILGIQMIAARNAYDSANIFLKQDILVPPVQYDGSRALIMVASFRRSDNAYMVIHAPDSACEFTIIQIADGEELRGKVFNLTEVEKKEIIRQLTVLEKQNVSGVYCFIMVDEWFKEVEEAQHIDEQILQHSDEPTEVPQVYEVVESTKLKLFDFGVKPPVDAISRALLENAA